jgi:DNA-binding MarR family transcriptional regulator
MDDDKASKMDAIVDNVHFVIPLFFRTILRRGEGLTHNPMTNDFRVLSILGRHGTLPTSRIGDWLHVSKPNMTAIIDRLIEEGLVERQRGDEDRRVVNVALTEKGKEYLHSCHMEAREAVKRILSSLSPEELDTLYSSLQSVRLILSKINEVDPTMKHPLPPFAGMDPRTRASRRPHDA